MLLNIYKIVFTSYEADSELYFSSQKYSKQGYVAISQTENTKYEVEKEGKHKFRLICTNDKIEEVDMDVTYIKIFDCKGIYSSISINCIS